MKKKRVKCGKCGFLALRQKWDRMFLEADDDYRKSIERPRNENLEIIDEGTPICFRAKHDLRNEIAKIRSENIAEDIQTIMWKERLCDGFMSWTRGVTPKDHLEILDRERWRRWQAEESRKIGMHALPQLLLRP